MDFKEILAWNSEVDLWSSLLVGVAFILLELVVIKDDVYITKWKFSALWSGVGWSQLKGQNRKDGSCFPIIYVCFIATAVVKHQGYQQKIVARKLNWSGYGNWNNVSNFMIDSSSYDI